MVYGVLLIYTVQRPMTGTCGKKHPQDLYLRWVFFFYLIRYTYYILLCYIKYIFSLSIKIQTHSVLQIYFLCFGQSTYRLTGGSFLLLSQYTH